ncbi:hypothetical protein H6764_02830 [Candidatus Nomurabacteria bacterium]|nr:hypothetical protein [Candidatus Nomurabacteria bacterium]
MSNPDKFGLNSLDALELSDALAEIDRLPLSSLADYAIRSAWSEVYTGARGASSFQPRTLLLMNLLGIDLNHVFGFKGTFQAGNFELPQPDDLPINMMQLAEQGFIDSIGVFASNLSSSDYKTFVNSVELVTQYYGFQRGFEICLATFNSEEENQADLRPSVLMMKMCLRLSQEYSASQAEE